jgi:hypothetical protein
MPEYDLGFAAKLAETADILDERQPGNYDARRVIVYLSRLSMEIALKALLEQAGLPVRTIRQRSHSLSDLLSDLDNCEVLTTLDGESNWNAASIVRNEAIDMGMVKIPIGELVAATHPELSLYPNEIRYGHKVVDFDPVYLVGAANVLTTWAQANIKTIRLRVR